MRQTSRQVLMVNTVNVTLTPKHRETVCVRCVVQLWICVSHTSSRDTKTFVIYYKKQNKNNNKKYQEQVSKFLLNTNNDCSTPESRSKPQTAKQSNGEKEQKPSELKESSV